MGSSVPGGFVWRALGASGGSPLASMAHLAGERRRSARRRFVRPLVVMDIETAMIAGSPPVGHAAANGLGVNTPRRPPKGATLAMLGSEHVRIAIKPWSVARFKYPARQPM